ncbi:spore germination cell wall hydrolase CwlJ-like protein [Virgibacillus natechei]|uniref:Spore germination cell wall hydrolase CwlJ-like protein n=1 Tax=Virgibacillus natechei TaxID=1216297 RepID=A0ABS4IES9_9BACI|nr:spore germination cell wall hydrolase CwlJ-like protein [Virgibacillus natechei]
MSEDDHIKQNASYSFRPAGECPPTWYDEPFVGQYKLHCFYEPIVAECEEYL